MSRRVDYVGPSCGKHVDEPSDLQLLGQALGGIFVALVAGSVVFGLVFLAFGLGDGP
jgi:hypothetical protein